MKPEKLWGIAVETAKQIANKSGLKVGQTVSHESDFIAYALLEIVEDLGVVWIPGKLDSIKTFPLSELFDSKDFIRELVKHVSEDVDDVVNSAKN